MTTPKPLVHTPAQVRAVSGPTQHRLLSALERLGECSVADLAAAAGLSPESIYYHIRNFERVGIVSRTGEQPAGRRTEALFQLNAKTIDFDAHNTTPAYTRAMGKMIGTLLRMAARACETALDTKTATWSGRYRNANMHQHFLRIPKSNLAEAHRKIDALFDELQLLDDENENQWITITLVSCPLVNPD